MGEELLKGGRALYRTYLVICGVALLMSWRPTELEQYSEIRGVLEYLSSTQHDQRLLIAIDDVNQEIDEHFRKYEEKIDAVYSLLKAELNPVMGRMPEDLLRTKFAKSVGMKKLISPDVDTGLRELARFYNSSQAIQLPVLDVVEVLSAFDSHLESWRKFHFGEMKLEWPHKSSNSEFSFEGKVGGISVESISVTPDASKQARISSVGKKYFERLGTTAPLDLHIPFTADGFEHPMLNRFLPEVGDNSIHEALRYYRNKEQELLGKIMIMGFSIDRRIAKYVLLGFMLCGLILLEKIFAKMRAATALLAGTEDNFAMRVGVFPWLLLVDGYVGWVVRWATLVVLPTVSVAFFFFPSCAALIRGDIQLVFVVVVAAAGVTALSSLERAQSKLEEYRLGFRNNSIL